MSLEKTKMKTIELVAELSGFDSRCKYILTISSRFRYLAKACGDHVKLFGGYELEVVRDGPQSAMTAQTAKQSADQNLVSTNCQRELRVR
jgi:hypothetical protein